MPDPVIVRESFKIQGADFAKTIKALLHDGNVRNVVVEDRGRTIAEFPLAGGLVGLLMAPALAAVASLVALATDCTIHVERTASDTPVPVTPSPTAA